MRRPSITVRLLLVGVLAVLPACSKGGSGPKAAAVKHAPSTGTSSGVLSSAVPGVYAHTGVHDLSPAVAGVPTRVYVPNSESNTVDVIDPVTFKIVDHFAVGQVP